MPPKEIAVIKVEARNKKYTETRENVLADNHADHLTGQQAAN